MNKKKQKKQTIDFDKFLCSLFAQGVFPKERGKCIRNNIENALQDQGLEYNGGEIVQIEKSIQKKSYNPVDEVKSERPFTIGDVLTDSSGDYYIFKCYIDEHHFESLVHISNSVIFATNSTNYGLMIPNGLRYATSIEIQYVFNRILNKVEELYRRIETLEKFLKE